MVLADTCITSAENNTRVAGIIVEFCNKHFADVKCPLCATCGFDSNSFISGMKTGVIIMSVLLVVMMAIVLHYKCRNKSDEEWTANRPRNYGSCRPTNDMSDSQDESM